ncbi:MAG: DUF2625 family protein [Planctomycetota bacterium]
MRTLAELIHLEEPGIELVRGWAAEGGRAELLPRDPARAEVALVALQVSTRSPMGAVVYETGGLLVDHGWVRVLGGGGAGLPALDAWNRCVDARPQRLPGALVVGWDVLGGFFALNGGAFGGPVGQVFYFAPDALEWESFEGGYSDWLSFLLAGDLAPFYGDARWPGWEQEAAGVPGDRALNVLPWLSCAGPPLAERSRRAVPVEELWGLFVRGEREPHG